MKRKQKNDFKLGFNRKQFINVSVITCVGTLASQGAFAQTASNDLSLADILDIDTVTVASAFKETELKAGSAVSVITEDEWKKQGSVKTLEPLDFQPGMLNFSNSNGVNYMAIRGYASSSSAKGTALLLDGIPLNDYFYGTGAFGRGRVDNGVLGRMEIIRGPASYIYGSDAFHGVISMKSWKSDKDAVQAWAGYGSDALYQTQLKVSQGITKDIRVTALFGASGNGDLNQSNTYTGTLYNSATVSAAVKALTKVDAVPLATYPAFKTSTTLTDQKDLNQMTVGLKLNLGEVTEAGFYYVQARQIGSPYLGDTLGTTVPLTPQALGINSGNDSTGYMGKLSSTVGLGGGFDLDGKVYYASDSSTSIFQIPQLASAYEWDAVTPETRGGLGLTLKRDKTEQFPVRLTLGYTVDYFGQTTRSSASTGTFLTPIVSGSSGTAISAAVLPTLNAVYGSGLATALFATTPSTAFGSTRTINAVNLMTDTALFSDRVHVLLGGRYDTYSDISNTPLSPRAGLVVGLTDTSSLKFLYGTGFRAPAVLEIYGSGGITGGGPSLQPETIATEEVQYLNIVKGNSFSAGVYYNQWNNGILLNTATTYANSGSNIAYGLELSDKYQLMDNLSVFGNFSYARSAATTGGNYNDYLVYPMVMVNWGAQYAMPGAGLEFALFNHHQMFQSYSQVATSGALPAYFRTDLTASYDVSGFFGAKTKTAFLGLQIRNLLNQTLVNASPINVGIGQQEPGAAGMVTASAKF